MLKTFQRAWLTPCCMLHLVLHALSGLDLIGYIGYKEDGNVANNLCRASALFYGSVTPCSFPLHATRCALAWFRLGTWS